jgi:Xaa-Pro aminopeptidase
VWYNKKSIVNPALQNNAVNDFIKEGKHSEIENVSTILQTLRLFKSQTEVNLMRKSCDIVADAFREVMMYSHPGVSFVGCIDLILLPANVQLFLTFQFFLPISVSNISYTRLLSFILLPTCTDMAFF